MNHNDYQEQVSLYLDGVLGDGASTNLFAHLAECEECRSLLRVSMRLREHMAEQDLATVPSSLDSRILGSIPAMGEQSSPLAPKELDKKILGLARNRLARQGDRQSIHATIWQRRISMRLPAVAVAASMIILGSFLLASVWSPLRKAPPQVQIQTVYVTTLPTVEVHGYMP
jgi:hypothetical protein